MAQLCLGISRPPTSLERPCRDQRGRVSRCSREHGITHSWFDGIIPVAPVAPGTPEETDKARLGAARVVRRSTELGACPIPPLHEVGPNHPPPAANRAELSQDAQWLAYLFDYLGLWPETARNRHQAKRVRDCGPMSKRPR